MTKHTKAVLRVLLQGLLFTIAVALMVSSIGCGTAPAPKGPPTDVRVPCPDITPLEVLPGLNSNQLDDVLYAAYLELLGQYIACQQQQQVPTK